MDRDGMEEIIRKYYKSLYSGEVQGQGKIKQYLKKSWTSELMKEQKEKLNGNTSSNETPEERKSTRS